MIETIKACHMCELCSNQEPLLDRKDICEIIWVGLSAKKTKDITDFPLSEKTNSGKLIAEIEKNIENINSYKTNIVKCPPLNGNGKLRYPTKKEMEICIENLIKEINYFKPKIVFLLGNEVSIALQSRLNIVFTEKNNVYNYSMNIHNGIYFIPIHHPSFIHVYKRKDKPIYINRITEIVQECLI